MSFRLVLLAASSLAITVGAQAQDPEPRLRRLPSTSGMTFRMPRFTVPRMTMRVMPRIHPDVQALRFRTEQRALDRMNQARERQFAQRDRTLTRQRELADRIRIRSFDLQDRARSRALEQQDRVRERVFEQRDRAFRRELDVRARVMDRMHERMNRLVTPRIMPLRRHFRTI